VEEIESLACGRRKREEGGMSEVRKKGDKVEESCSVIAHKLE